jgi:hypothetical protein
LSRRWIATAGLPRALKTNLALGHETRFDQIVEHDIRACPRGSQVDMRCELGRRLEQAGEHGSLGEVYLTRRFAKIELCRGIDAEGAAAHLARRDRDRA